MRYFRIQESSLAQALRPRCKNSIRILSPAAPAVAACGPAMMELEAIDEAPLPPRPRTADLTLPPIATKAEARRALDAKEVWLGFAGRIRIRRRETFIEV